MATNKVQLYLEGNKCDEVILVPANSLISVFVLQYCKTPIVEVNFVNIKIQNKQEKENDFNQLINLTKNLKIINQDGLFPINYTDFVFPCSFMEEDECPNMVRNCLLPTVVQESWCVAGLCSCLRFILKYISETQASHFSEALLGFRRSCLQACAEVSVWTKFCEIEMLSTLNFVYRKDLINVSKLYIPKDLLRYEYHLQHPPILHNALKQKQNHIRKTIKNKEDQQELIKKPLSALPNLEHKYAEGLHLTLADVMLYVSFHLIIYTIKDLADLKMICPLVLKWHALVSDNANIKACISILDLAITKCKINSQFEKYEIVIPDIINESLYKSDPDRYKPHLRAYTHQNDIEDVVNKLLSEIIDPKYDLNPREGSITMPWKTYPDAVSPKEGNLPSSRLERKHQQLDNMVAAVLSIIKVGDVIVDFCAGGGHLGIVLAYLLPKCTVIFIENKDVSLEKAKVRSGTLGLKNVQFYQSNLDYFIGSFTLGVCLHACGTATDLVLEKCIHNKACFVTCPCCYGSVQPNHVVAYPRSNLYQNIGISIDEYLILGHAADQTHDENNPKTKQGQLCMRLIDKDRLACADTFGYKTSLLQMDPMNCSPKNHILIGELIK